MQNDFNPQQLFALAELAQLRSHALDLYDRCLAEGNPAPIIAFIERHLASDPPQLQLLRDLAEDLQQRLLSLRTYHYDVRNNVLKTFSESYGVDISPLIPANAPQRYHELNPAEVISYANQLAVKNGKPFTTEDELLLAKLLDASVKTAERLFRDINLTAELQTMVLDWFDALSSTVGRRFWTEQPPPKPPIH